MPNWVSTQVSIKGSQDELNRFLKGINESKSIMESYLPCPQELRDTMSGFIANDEEAMEELRKKQEENIAKFGHKDWYEWQYEVWGTKWGDCDTNFEPVVGNELQGYFMTPWGPALNGFLRISKMFPTLMFVFTYDEEAGFFAGIEAIQNGEIIFEEMFAPSEYGEELDFDDDESYEKYDEYKNEHMENIQIMFDNFMKEMSA
jgi:hypothetical protein